MIDLCADSDKAKSDHPHHCHDLEEKHGPMKEMEEETCFDSDEPVLALATAMDETLSEVALALAMDETCSCPDDDEFEEIEIEPEPFIPPKQINCTAARTNLGTRQALPSGATSGS